MPSPGSGLVLVWSPLYEVDIGRHVFPTAKYRLVKERLHRDGTLVEPEFVQPDPATWEEVGRIHTQDYLKKIQTDSLSVFEQMRLEVPFSPALREASLLCCGGTTLTARLALRNGVAVHLGGGFHHAFAGHGEGFCLLNDVAVALATLLAEGEIESAAVVDLDVHHGNGTAAIFSTEPRVFTLSMHQERNYPHPKPPSDLDIGLADGTGDVTYLRLLETALAQLFEDASPEVVLYLAGADPYLEDQLGGLALSLGGLRERDDMVLRSCRSSGAGVGVLLAGGYARREEDTVKIHAGTVTATAAALATG